METNLCKYCNFPILSGTDEDCPNNLANKKPSLTAALDQCVKALGASRREFEIAAYSDKSSAIMVIDAALEAAKKARE